jgi:hypothetical protein
MDKRCKNCKQFVVFQDNLPDVGYCKLEVPILGTNNVGLRQVKFMVKEAQMSCNKWAAIPKKPGRKKK